MMEKISATDIEQWANLLECRDDVGFEVAHGDLLREFVHELANPLLTRRMTPSRAREWVTRLEEAEA